jgi:serine/threonine-protein kinase RsbW
MMSSQTRKPARKSAKKTVTNEATKAAKKTFTQTHAMPVAAIPENEGEHVEIRIPADARWVRLVRLGAAGVASVLNFSVEEIEDIKLAVSEACNNAILHAQPVHSSRSEPRPTILITLIPARDYLEIHVEDQGRLGREITSPPPKRKTSSSSDSLPVGGLGLLIMQTVMDEVRYHTGDDTNTKLCMVKYRRPAEGQAKR